MLLYLLYWWLFSLSHFLSNYLMDPLPKNEKFENGDRGALPSAESGTSMVVCRLRLTVPWRLIWPLPLPARPLGPPLPLARY